MATKDDIKKAAASLFAIKGFEATTMNDIADAVGLKKQSLYSHIRSKSELYLTIINERTDLMWEEIVKHNERIKGVTEEEYIKGFFKSVIEVFTDRENLLLWRRTIIIYFSDESATDFKQADWKLRKKVKDELYRELSGRYERFANKGYFNEFFLTFLVLVHGYLSWMMISHHNNHTLECAWQNYWAGANKYFEDTQRA